MLHTRIITLSLLTPRSLSLVTVILILIPLLPLILPDSGRLDQPMNRTGFQPAALVYMRIINKQFIQESTTASEVPSRRLRNIFQI